MLGISSSQLTNSIIFQRGRVDTTNQFNMSRGFSHVKLYLGVFHWAHVGPTHFDLVTGELRPLRGKKRAAVESANHWACSSLRKLDVYFSPVFAE